MTQPSNSPLWDSLVASALLGTDRRPFAPSNSTDAVGQLLSRLDPSDPETTLLNAAAIVALHRRAGRLPATTKVQPPSPAESDSNPECPSQASQHLMLMLNDHYADLLPEWLTLVASKNLRAPAEHLPALLDLGVSKAEQREAISKVIGQRGEWLAQQNVQWGYVSASSDDAAIWQTGIKPQRVSLLSKLRQHAPNQARELLQTTWSQEVASDRWAFVQTLRIGLSMADEPFLEEALDDRAKDVRAIAAELLKQLPKSRLCARMTERLKEFVQWKGGKKLGFTVTLPDDCSKEMERDGVQGKATQGAQVLGEKSLWLTQIANAVPLSAWEALCEKTEPEKIVQVAARSKDWAVLLLGGLSASAARDGELVWVEALLGEDKVPARHALFAGLPINKKEQYILKLLSAKLSVKQGETVTPYIFGAQHPWSKKLSQKILDALFQDLTSDSIKYSYQLASLLELLARHLHPSLIPTTITRLPGVLKQKSPMTKEIEKVIAKMQFRIEMINAIQSKGDKR